MVRFRIPTTMERSFIIPGPLPAVYVSFSLCPTFSEYYILPGTVVVTGNIIIFVLSSSFRFCRCAQLKYEDPLCKVLKIFLYLIGVRATVDPEPIMGHEDKEKAA